MQGSKWSKTGAAIIAALLMEQIAESANLFNTVTDLLVTITYGGGAVSQAVGIDSTNHAKEFGFIGAIEKATILLSGFRATSVPRVRKDASTTSD